jgi:hypothetical protein
MKSCLVRCAVAGVASLLTGGFLGYSYGAYVYSLPEKIIQAATKLELAAQARLKAKL